MPLTLATLHGRVFAAASALGASVALTDGRRRISYEELVKQSVNVAVELARHGVQPGSTVAVMTAKTVNTPAVLLGILGAGCSYVAIDPASPPRRRSETLQAVRAAMLVTEHSGSASAAEVPTVEQRQLLYSESHGDPSKLPQGSPEDIAYVMFTSGSTGRPKGVLTEHGSVVRFVDAITAKLEIDHQSRFLQFYPMTFDSSIVDLWAVLVAGGCAVMAPAEARSGGQRLVDFLADNRISAAMLPPALLTELEERPAVPTLETLAYIGESMPDAVAERWGRGRRLVNVYGPTEVTVAATASAERSPSGAPPIGRALPGYEVHVLDEHMQAVPSGTVGELYIGGQTLARGYLGQPGMTAERFLPDPFSGRSGARLYKTGDRAVELPDGQLEFRGRTDHQVNVRGHRIELGEIENVLLELDGVRASLAMVTGTGSGASLVAFAASDRPSRDLLEELAERLPPHVLPSRLFSLASLPLNHHGKVDRPNLLELLRTSDRDAVALRGSTEVALGAIWSDVLGRPVGAQSSFLSLGGTSLQAVRVASVVLRDLGVVVSVSELLSDATIRDLADLLASPHRKPASQFPELTHHDSPSTRAASPNEESIWLQAAIDPRASIAYNETIAARVEDYADLVRLQTALDVVVSQHEAFRSSFHLRDDQLCVDIAPVVGVPIDVLDVSGDSDPAGAARMVLQERAAAPFDLEVAPLIRATLVHTGEREYMVAWTAHHLVIDALGFDEFDRVLAEAFERSSRSASSKTPHTGQQPPISPSDLARWRRRFASDASSDVQAQDVARMLEGVPTVLPPLRKALATGYTYRGSVVSARIPTDVYSRIEERGRAIGVTQFVQVAAAAGLAVATATGTTDLALAAPLAGRPTLGAERSVGYFANTALLRLRFAEDDEIVDVLRAFAGRVSAAIEHQYVPLRDVLDRVEGSRTLAGRPVAQLVVANQGPRRPNAALGSAPMYAVPIFNGTSRTDLSFELHEEGGGFLVDLIWSEDTVGKHLAERILASMQDVLDRLTALPLSATVSEATAGVEIRWTAPRTWSVVGSTGDR